MTEPLDVRVERFDLDENLVCEQDADALGFRFSFSRSLDDEELRHFGERLKLMQMPFKRGKVEVEKGGVLYFAYPRDAQQVKDRLNGLLHAMLIEFADRRAIEEQRGREAAEARRRLLDEGRRAVESQR